MKHCPQCKTVFGNEDLFCFEDGTALVETAPQPSAFVANADPALAAQTGPPQYSQQTASTSASRNYLKPLAAGLVLGGLLVMVLYFMISGFGESRKDHAAKPDTAHAKKYANSPRQPDSRFNGRVVMANAYIRSQPDMSSDSEMEMLPNEERVNILRRKGPNSPWYYITCEHGVSGWIHGDMIEFTGDHKF